MKKNPRFPVKKLKIASSAKPKEEVETRIIPKPSFLLYLRVVDITTDADKEEVEVTVRLGPKKLSHTLLVDKIEAKVPLPTDMSEDRVTIVCSAGTTRIGSVSI